MSRTAAFLYGVGVYALSLVVFAYLAGFVGGFLVPRPLDGAPVGPLGTSLLIDLALVALFGLQHSVMARPGFKRAWTRIVPASIERSTYMLATNLALGALFWQWRPLGGALWSIESPAGRAVIYGLQAVGWALLLYVTFVINHFDLFGLRQVWLNLLGRVYGRLHFVTPGPYQVVRHPLYIGWLTIFWAAPTMTASHLVFAVAMTAYILVAIRYEERDLVDMHPEYAHYRRRVPMLNPFGRRAPAGARAIAGDPTSASAAGA
jgi:protein-S-isoprenylcysteine O-methyltransferase Ste14